MNSTSRRVTIIGMLSGIAFLSVLLIRIPIVLFLNYEPKDVIITIGGLIWGPMAAISVSFITSFIEFITISGTGPIGFIFNFVASVIFACIPAIFYSKYKTLKSAIVGLIVGSIITIITMILWNYIVTPFYMGVSREEVVKLLMPAILPFNLIKCGLNTGLTLLLYKPIINKLKNISSLHLELNHPKKVKSHINISVLILSLVLIGISVAIYLFINK